MVNRTTELENEMMDRIGKEIADEIDFEIISDMLIFSGWTKVVLRPMTSEHGDEIDAWVATNVKGKHRTMGLVWIFEKSEDATWFTVRWMS